MGLIDTISLVGTLVLALPIAMLGVEFLLGGRTAMGVAFVAIAGALVVGQHYISVFDVKERVVGTAVDAVVLEEDGGDGDGFEGATADDGDVPESYE